MQSTEVAFLLFCGCKNIQCRRGCSEIYHSISNSVSNRFDINDKIKDCTVFWKTAVSCACQASNDTYHMKNNYNNYFKHNK